MTALFLTYLSSNCKQSPVVILNVVVVKIEKKLQKLSVLCLVIAVSCLGSCTEQPTKEQLALWRKQASDRNAQIVAEKIKNNEQSQWNLTIQGQTSNEKSVKLSWPEILNLATTNIINIDANNIQNPKEQFKFQGIAVKTLLEKFGVQPGVTEVTFVCYDAYQVTVKVEDILKYPILLAVTKNGQAITREQGGPVYLIFPYNQYPQLQKKYDAGFWGFYVTDVIVGTEKPILRVDAKELNTTDLDKLPEIRLTQNVLYRKGWPSGIVKLYGVRLRDVLKLANIQLKQKKYVIVQGKAPVYQKNSDPIKLLAEDVNNCNIILATKWGEDKQPIPAKMGGPVTLVFGKNCGNLAKNERWVTFVEGVKIEQ
jgi:hypothetical protein